MIETQPKPAEGLEIESPYTPNPPDIHRLAPARDDWLFLALSLIIGVISGLLIICFRVSINWLQVLVFGSAPHPGLYRLLIVPAAVGLLIAILVHYIFPAARGSGVNQTKAALYIYNGFISFRTVVGKFITSALAIGGGFSLGPEDPSLQIGAGVASLIGRRFRLSRERLRMFAPIGAAAGLAVAFNAPISAIIFVIEEVIGRWSAAVLGSIVLAAFSSVAVARAFWGPEPMFRIPSVTIHGPRQLIAFCILGVAGGIVGLIFSKGLVHLRAGLTRLPRWTRFLHSSAAGLMIGAIAFFGVPQIMGAGYGIIDQAIHGQFTWKFLLALCLLKVLATTLASASKTPGGLFAPSLFIGAMLGGTVGSLEKVLFPHMEISIGCYALVGMGVIFAGFLRVPLTSVFMVIEVSGNYSIILPVILANTIAYLVSRALHSVPIYEAFTLQDGYALPSLEDQREETPLHLEDALRPVTAPIFSCDDTFSAISERLALTDVPVFLIRTGDEGWYAMSRDEFRALADGKSGMAIGRSLSSERTPVLFPDLPLDSAIPHLRRWPLLPVRNRVSGKALEGTVTLEDVLSRYQNR